MGLEPTSPLGRSHIQIRSSSGSVWGTYRASILTSKSPITSTVAGSVANPGFHAMRSKLTGRQLKPRHTAVVGRRPIDAHAHLDLVNRISAVVPNDLDRDRVLGRPNRTEADDGRRWTVRRPPFRSHRADRPYEATFPRWRLKKDLSPVQRSRSGPWRVTQTSLPDAGSSLVTNLNEFPRQSALGGARDPYLRAEPLADHHRRRKVPHRHTGLVRPRGSNQTSPPFKAASLPAMRPNTMHLPKPC